MKINDKVIGFAERVSFTLRELFYSYGYRGYRMNKFEEYDLYSDNKEFLVSDNVITFTDNGKLMALKPDVTLSIIKNSKFSDSEIKKVFYSENVYREDGDSRSFKEIMQTGLECFGKLSANEVTEVITLAAKSIKAVSDDCVIDISSVSVLKKLVSRLGLDAASVKDVFERVGKKDLDGLKSVALGENGETLRDIVDLISICGKISEVMGELEGLKERINDASFDEFLSVLSVLEKSDVKDVFRVDFSVVGDINYYNGIVFKGFVKNAPAAVLSGGQYDNLMKKFLKSGKAIGFAVYLDLLERAFDDKEAEKDDYINVALPKGRLGERIYSIFERAGYECPSVLNPNRKLVFVNDEKKVRFFWVKPSDVTIYVERGAADVGVAGKDTLLEYEPDVYELSDLKEGQCKMVVAGQKSFEDDSSKTLRVATKFTNIAREFYLSKGREIDVIRLNGSIEIAPILGLSDVIVDIVETGATLKENDLKIIETVCPISARLIANKSSSKFKSDALGKMLDNIRKAVNEK